MLDIKSAFLQGQGCLGTFTFVLLLKPKVKEKCEHCSITGILACHMDDFIWGGSHIFATAVIPHIKTAFQVGCMITFVCRDGLPLLKEWRCNKT